MRANFELGTKWCSRCEQTLVIGAFGPNKRMIDGLANYCRKCKAASMRLPYDHPQRVKQRERWAAIPFDDPRKIRERERNKQRYHANPTKFSERNRKTKLKREYGLTVDQFNSMLAEQNGKCAICGTDDFQGKRPHIDHHHDTGEVRGLLCVRCNQGVGNFLDDPDRMRAAIVYLERWLTARKRAA